MIEYENLFLSNKEFREEFKIAFDKVLASGWFILGKQVNKFEELFARSCGAKYCIGVASGLDALFLSLKALEHDRKKNEVILAANSYVACILAVINAGLRPVLVEPDINTYNLDPSKIEERITKNTLAIIPVHLYGKLCDMKRIMKIAKRKKLVVIEDCAQAHGAKYRNRIAGTFGQFGAYSFYPTKNLGALGDAGAVITNDVKFARQLRLLRNYGSEKKYYNEILGYNSRLDEFQAALLQVKLKKLEQIGSHKRKLASIYNGYLKDDFIKPVHDHDYHDVFHIYAIRHRKRDYLRKYLLDKGIKTEVHYPVPPYRQKALQGFFIGQKFVLSDDIHNTILSLPISYFHSTDDIERVCEILNKF